MSSVSKGDVLALLQGAAGEFCAGPAMSRQLGISRAAVWKAVEALRKEGCEIESQPRLGYRLLRGPDRLSRETMAPWLQTQRLGRRLICLEEVDSTNDEAKRLALQGAEDGTVILAEGQSAGRGRNGRAFASPIGQGVWLSVLLRPDLRPEQALHYTAWCAVAVCDAVEALCGQRPGIKWPNDVILNGRKLCGILTEMALEGESGRLQYVVLGLGLNVNWSEADMGPELAPVAASLYREFGKEFSRPRAAAELLNALERVCDAAGDPAAEARLLERYRRDCLIPGREVRLLRSGGEERALALGVDPDYRLRVRLTNGREEALNSGEISVRGLLGYTD